MNSVQIVVQKFGGNSVANNKKLAQVCERIIEEIKTDKILKELEEDTIVIVAGFKDVELVPIYEREYFKNEYLFKQFLKKVPIIDDFSEEFGDNKDYYSPGLDENILKKYIQENTYKGKIRLLRRYYGISARK